MPSVYLYVAAVLVGVLCILIGYREAGEDRSPLWNGVATAAVAVGVLATGVGAVALVSHLIAAG